MKRYYMNKLIEAIKSMTKEEIVKLFKVLQEALSDSSKTIENQTVKCCPRCGSVSFKKNGTNGIQRYLCKDCHKSFTDKTNTFFSYSHISTEIWKQFIDFEYTGLSLREESYYLHISMATCFKMRHKLQRALSNYHINETKLSGEIQLDSAYFKINLKGTKPSNMPRQSKNRGNTSAFSGISHHKICVVCAIDENDEMLMNIAGLGTETFSYYKKQENYFDNPKLAVADSKAAIQLFCNFIGITVDKIIPSPVKKRFTTKNGNSVCELNQLIAEYRTKMKSKHGIGLRYFQEYLNQFIVNKQFRYKYQRDDYASKILEILNNSLYSSAKTLSNIELPISLKEAYYDYHYGIFSD